MQDLFMELLIKFLKKHLKKNTIYSNVVRCIYKIPQLHGLCDVLGWHVLWGWRRFFVFYVGVWSGKAICLTLAI